MKNREESITLTAEEFGAFAICSVRYSLGRMTYMPELITGLLIKSLDKLTTKDLYVMANDIKDAPSYGDEKIDKPTWMRFLFMIIEEIDRRESKGE